MSRSYSSLQLPGLAVNKQTVIDVPYTIGVSDVCDTSYYIDSNELFWQCCGIFGHMKCELLCLIFDTFYK